MVVDPAAEFATAGYNIVDAASGGNNISLPSMDEPEAQYRRAQA